MVTLSHKVLLKRVMNLSVTSSVHSEITDSTSREFHWLFVNRTQDEFIFPIVLCELLLVFICILMTFLDSKLEQSYRWSQRRKLYYLFRPMWAPGL